MLEIYLIGRLNNVNIKGLIYIIYNYKNYLIIIFNLIRWEIKLIL